MQIRVLHEKLGPGQWSEGISLGNARNYFRSTTIKQNFKGKTATIILYNTHCILDTALSFTHIWVCVTAWSVCCALSVVRTEFPKAILLYHTQDTILTHPKNP